MSHAAFEGTARASDRWLIIGPVVLMALWIGLCAWSVTLLGAMMSEVASATHAAPPHDTRARIAAATSAAPDLCPLPTDRVSARAR
jgi:hypothetical protein